MSGELGATGTHLYGYLAYPCDAQIHKSTITHWLRQLRQQFTGARTIESPPINRQNIVMCIAACPAKPALCRE